MNVATVLIVGGMLFTCCEATEAIINHTPMERRGVFRRLLWGVSWMIPVAVIAYTIVHLLAR